MNKDTIELLSRLFTPTGTLIAAIAIGLFTALYTAVIKFFFDKRLKISESSHQRELIELREKLAGETQLLLQNLQAESNRRLKQLEADLTEKTQRELQKSQFDLTEEQSRKQSRLDYEYEARKRLYHECEPLIFELLEFSENACDRIRGIARTARQGNLPAWLSDDKYYMASTMYYLLAPVAVYKLMRRRLTTVDMRLDRNIAVHYQLAKQVAWSFVDDFSFARDFKDHLLGYDPHTREWETLRFVDETKYWSQGFPYGRLDNAVESMIIHDPNGELRIRSFGDFESELHNAGSAVDKTFFIVRDVFTNFHPSRRPVLWRMLLAQAHIYTAIVRYHRNDSSVGDLVITPIPADERQPFHWTKPQDKTELERVEEPFTVAEAYLSKNIPALWVK